VSGEHFENVMQQYSRSRWHRITILPSLPPSLPSLKTYRPSLTQSKSAWGLASMRPIGSREVVKPLAVCEREGGRGEDGKEGGSGGAVGEWKRRAWKLGGEIKRQVDSRKIALNTGWHISSCCLTTIRTACSRGPTRIRV